MQTHMLEWTVISCPLPNLTSTSYQHPYKMWLISICCCFPTNKHPLLHPYDFHVLPFHFRPQITHENAWKYIFCKANTSIIIHSFFSISEATPMNCSELLKIMSRYLFPFQHIIVLTVSPKENQMAAVSHDISITKDGMST